MQIIESHFPIFIYQSLQRRKLRPLSNVLLIFRVIIACTVSKMSYLLQCFTSYCVEVIYMLDRVSCSASMEILKAFCLHLQ